MSNEDNWTENSQWILRSIDALYLAVKDHDEKIDQKFGELKVMMSKEITARAVLAKDYEKNIEQITKDLTRRTTITNGIAVIIVAIGVLLYELLK